MKSLNIKDNEPPSAEKRYNGIIHVLAIIALTISASATVGISILIALKGCDTIVVEYSTGGRNTVDVASGFVVADILIGL